MKKKSLTVGIVMITLIILLATVLVIKYRSEDSNNDNEVFNNKSNSDNNTNIEPLTPSEIPKDNTDGGDNIKNTILETLEPVETTAIETPRPAKINLVFAGDVLLYERNTPYYDRNGLEGLLEKELIEKFNNSDISMINEEFPFSDRGTKADDKQFTFRAAPKYIKVFKDMGIDIVTLANNHTLDFGRDALTDTIDTLNNADIKYVGAGENIEEAKKIEYFNVKGKTIAYIGASRVIPFGSWYAGEKTSGLLGTYDPKEVISLIKEARKKSDFIIIYVHWGIERNEKPEGYQRNMGKQYIDAGADFVIGSHPHVLQGIEFYNEKPIIYSLGNFIFSSKTERTAILNIDINENNTAEISLTPCMGENFKTYKINDYEKRKDFYKYIESISYDINIDDEGIVTPKN